MGSSKAEVVEGKEPDADVEFTGKDAFFAFALMLRHPAAAEKMGCGVQQIKWGVNKEFPDTKVRMPPRTLARPRAAAQGAPSVPRPPAQAGGSRRGHVADRHHHHGGDQYPESRLPARRACRARSRAFELCAHGPPRLPRTVAHTRGNIPPF